MKKIEVSSYLKKFSRKTKIIITSIVMSLPILLGAGLTLPGMGMESLKFIHSVEDFIETNIPKGKYMLNTAKTLTKPFVTKAIETSYTGDVLSAVDWNNEFEVNPDKITEYNDFAEQWFHDRWDKDLESGTPIDLYDVSMDLIKFDEAVAGKFFEFGYVNPGITWIFQPQTLSRLFDTNVQETTWFNDVIRKQTVISQDQYDLGVDADVNDFTGITINESIGSYLVNNKVWFLNLQIENITNNLKKETPGDKLTDVFIGDLDKEDVPRKATVNDFYHPNFTSAFKMTQAGVSLLLIIGPASLIAGGVGIYFIKKNNPKESKNKK